MRTYRVVFAAWQNCGCWSGNGDGGKEDKLNGLPRSEERRLMRVLCRIRNVREVELHLRYSCGLAILLTFCFDALYSIHQMIYLKEE